MLNPNDLYTLRGFALAHNAHAVIMDIIDNMIEQAGPTVVRNQHIEQLTHDIVAASRTAPRHDDHIVPTANGARVSGAGMERYIPTRKRGSIKEENVEDVERRLATGEALKDIGNSYGSEGHKGYNLIWNFCARHQIDYTPEGRAALRAKYGILENPFKLEAAIPAAGSTAAAPKRVDTSADKLISEHSGFAGEREDGKLVLEDLPNIEHQLRTDSIDDVAARYRTNAGELQKFLNRHSEVKITRVKSPGKTLDPKVHLSSTTHRSL